MKLKLKDIEANPHRNLDNNPVDEKRVEELRESIQQTGYWDNIVVRPHPVKSGKYQQAYGHHGLEAARREGLSEADLPVRDIDDLTMVRMMALENETQRGNNPAAVLDSVEAGQREMMYWMLKCETLDEFNLILIHESVSDAPFRNEQTYSRARNAVLEGNGVGREAVAWATGLKEGTLIQEATAQLKASGRLSAILREVEGRLKAEAAEAEVERKEQERIAQEARSSKERKKAERKVKKLREEQDRKQRAANNAGTACKESKKSNPVTFDLEGTKHLFEQTAAFNKFRTWCTSKGQELAKYLPVDQQQALAKHIVKTAETHNEGIVSREHVDRVCSSVRSAAILAGKKLKAADFERAIASDPLPEFRKQWQRTAKEARDFHGAVKKLAEMDMDVDVPSSWVTPDELEQVHNLLRRATQNWKKVYKLITE